MQGIKSLKVASPQVKSLHIYPIKSAAGIELSKAWLDDFGLSFDRRFVLSAPNGQFITARTEPSLCLIQVLLTPQGLVVSAPKMKSLTINYQAFSNNYQTVAVWDHDINAQHCLAQYDLWFSQYLNKPCQLLYFGQHSNRQVKNSTKSIAFADGYPLLLISQASLDDFNQRSGELFSMARFRPNIVVDNCAAFAEDSWQRIRIGEVEFELAKACSRCTFTTLEPTTAEKNINGEPLKTLKTYRQVEGGDIMFGQNLIALNQGQIHLDDNITVLTNKPALTFVFPTQPAEKTQQLSINETSAKVENKKPKINFSSWGKVHQGNNQDSILAQGEAAGLFMPYSCREGMCGACKVQLDSGEVIQKHRDGLSDLEQQAGFILSCSCVPTSDISISKIDRTKLRAIKEQEQQLQQQRLAKMNKS